MFRDYENIGQISTISRGINVLNKLHPDVQCTYTANALKNLIHSYY